MTGKNHGSFPNMFQKKILHFKPIFLIYSRKGFIQKQNLKVGYHSPQKSKSSFHSSGKLGNSFLFIFTGK